MDWMINNWFLIVAAVCMLSFFISLVVYFFKLPSEKQIANVKEWLKWAVTEAEKELGSGTGQLKLRFVYDMAVDKFPWILNLVSFDTFSGWVDEALEWMKVQLSKNAAISSFIDKEM